MVCITAKRCKGLRLSLVSKVDKATVLEERWAINPHCDQKFDDLALSFLVSQTHTASCFSTQVNPDAQKVGGTSGFAALTAYTVFCTG